MTHAILRLALVILLAGCKTVEPSASDSALPRDLNGDTPLVNGDLPGDAPLVNGDRSVGPSIPDPKLGVFPLHGQTSTGSSNPHVAIDNLGMPIKPAVFDSLAQTLTLLTWPELVVVPSKTSIPSTDFAALAPGIDVIPDQPLLDRWYIFKVGPVSKLQWPSTPAHVFPDGGRGFRFRTGSEPHVHSAIACDKKTAYSIVLSFSEPVLASQPPDAIIAIKQASNTLPITIPPNQLVPPAGGHSLAVTVNIDKQQPVVVEVKAGLHSLTNIPLDIAPSPISLDLTTLPLVTTGCVGKYLFP